MNFQSQPQPLKFAGSYRYAQQQGFDGTHAQFVDFLYKQYADGCRADGGQAEPFNQWYSVQVH